MAKPRLLDQAHRSIRLRHDSRRTEEAQVASCRASALLVLPSLLDRRTGNGAVRAKDAAVASLRAQQLAAGCTLVEEPTRIQRHLLLGFGTTAGTAQDRNQQHRSIGVCRQLFTGLGVEYM
jgi:hypothetical protein